MNLAGAKSLHVWDGTTQTFTILMSRFHAGVQVTRKFKLFFFFTPHMNQYFVRRKSSKSSELFTPPLWYFLKSVARDQLRDLQ